MLEAMHKLLTSIIFRRADHDGFKPLNLVAQQRLHHWAQPFRDVVRHLLFRFRRTKQFLDTRISHPGGQFVEHRNGQWIVFVFEVVRAGNAQYSGCFKDCGVYDQIVFNT